MKILDTELELDFLDADNVEKIEKQSKIVSDKLHAINTKERSVEIRETCIAIRECFDYIFGEGMSDKIFGNKYSLKIYLKAFHELIEERIRQEEEFSKEIESFSRYSSRRIERVK